MLSEKYINQKKVAKEIEKWDKNTAYNNTVDFLQ